MRYIKNSIWVWLIVLPYFVIGQNNNSKVFSLTGTLKNLKDPVSKVYLKSMDDDNIFYSLKVKNGMYSVKGSIDGPALINIFPGYAPGKRKSNRPEETMFLYLEPGVLKINHNGSFENMTVSGSLTQRDFEKVKVAVAINKKAGKSFENLNSLYADFVELNPASPYAIFALQSYVDNMADTAYYGSEGLPFDIQGLYLRRMKARVMDLEKIVPLFQSIPSKNRASSAGRNLLIQIEFAKIAQEHALFFSELDSLSKLYLSKIKEGDYQDVASLELKMQDIKYLINDSVYVPFIRRNPNSPIAMDLILWYSGGNFDDPSKVANLFKLVSDQIKESPEGSQYAKRLSTALKTAIGSVPPDFSAPDTSGALVSLSSFAGKYVLLDFWASWCAPCRKENPAIIKLYNSYKNKGFEVLSVSLDTDKKKWTQAIESDGLKWLHVSDLKNPNAVVKLYDILGVPANILIGPDGKILAKNLTGVMLESKLKSFMKQD